MNDWYLCGRLIPDPPPGTDDASPKPKHSYQVLTVSLKGGESLCEKVAKLAVNFIPNIFARKLRKGFGLHRIKHQSGQQYLLVHGHVNKVTLLQNTWIFLLSFSLFMKLSEIVFLIILCIIFKKLWLKYSMSKLLIKTAGKNNILNLLRIWLYYCFPFVCPADLVSGTWGASLHSSNISTL